VPREIQTPFPAFCGTIFFLGFQLGFMDFPSLPGKPIKQDTQTSPASQPIFFDIHPHYANIFFRIQ
jgi:hypothetical protein